MKRLIFAIVSLASVAAAQQGAPVPQALPIPLLKDTTPKPGAKAPDFELKDANGKVVHLSDYKGKVVVLDFWATWCAPCKAEIPWFMDFETQYKDRGFVVLGVSMDDDGWKVVTPFVAQEKISYQILLGNDKTGDLYGGVEALPTTFVIDREGKIASVHFSVTPREEFKNEIESLL